MLQQGGRKCCPKKILDYSRYLALPALGIALGSPALLGCAAAQLAKAFPYYHSFASLFFMITLERVWTYHKAQSQRHMIWRDLTSTMVQTFMVGAVFWRHCVRRCCIIFRRPSWAAASC